MVAPVGLTGVGYLAKVARHTSVRARADAELALHSYDLGHWDREHPDGVGRETGRDRAVGALAFHDRTLPCGVVAVEGAAGTGKTALLREFGRRATVAGAVVMTAACTTFDREVPFAVLTQLFLGPRLPKELRDDIGALLENALTDCGDAVMAHVHSRVCRAVAELVGPLPVTIVVDDAPRIDHRSEQVLAQLVHTLGPEGAVLVLADRTSTAQERHRGCSPLRPARRLPVRPMSGERWAAEVLLDAASVAMADERPERAAEYLRCACRSVTISTRRCGPGSGARTGWSIPRPSSAICPSCARRRARAG